MRKLFPGHFQPEKEEFDQMWQTGIFVFDTNVLLDIYRTTPAARDQLFKIWQSLQNRIWLPHQVVKEFMDNRLKIISDQQKVYGEIQKSLDSIITIIESHRRHISIDIEELSKVYRTASKKAKAILRKNEAEHPDLITDDSFLKRLNEIFSERVGDPYSPEQYDEYHKEAQKRIDAKIPPGYADNKKTDPTGDVMLWFQILDYAKLQQKPIFFITSDKKRDWLLEFEGKKLGPQPSLVVEMLEKAGNAFYIYTTDRFMKLATKFLGFSEQPAVIEEIRDLQRDEEAEPLQQGFAVSLGQVPSILQGVQVQSDAASIQSEAMKRFQQIAMPTTTLSAEQIDAWKSSADSAMQQYAQPATLAAQKYLMETFNQSEALNRALQLYAVPFAVDRKREQELSDLIKRDQQHQQELRDFFERDRKRHEEWQNQIARTYQSRLEAEARAQIKSYEEPTLAKARKQVEGYEQARVQAEAPQAMAQAGKGEQSLATAQPRTEASQAMAQAGKGEQPLAAAQPRTQTKKRKRQDEGDNTAQ